MAEGHSFRNSGYERREKEQYFTQHWCTQALCPHIPNYVWRGRVWEPAAGRGDIAAVLQADGIDVFCTDIDTSNFDHETGSISEADFLDPDVIKKFAGDSYGVTGIITNPPYGGKVDYYGKKISYAEAFVRTAIESGIPFVAMLLRSEFNHGARRRDLFINPDFFFSKEIVLTARPRWDWWYDKDPWEKDNAPMHNFSWFIWDANDEAPCTQVWVGPKDVGETNDDNNGEDDNENV